MWNSRSWASQAEKSWTWASQAKLSIMGWDGAFLLQHFLHAPLTASFFPQGGPVNDIIRSNWHPHNTQVRNTYIHRFLQLLQFRVCQELSICCDAKKCFPWFCIITRLLTLPGFNLFGQQFISRDFLTRWEIGTAEVWPRWVGWGRWGKRGERGGMQRSGG